MDLANGARRRRTAELAAVGAAVGWSVTLVAVRGDAVAAQILSNVGLLATALTAGSTALRRAFHHEGPDRRFWLLLGAAVLSWSLGQAVWTCFESVLGQHPGSPSLASIGYLALSPLAAAALLSLPTSAQSAAGRIRTIFDGLMVALSLLLCSWILVLRPVFWARAGAGDSPLDAYISLAYPIGDLVVITIVVTTWLRARRAGGRLPVSLPLVGTGLVAFGCADSGFSYATAVGSYRSGSEIDLGWFLGFVLILLAALRVPEAATPATAEPARAGQAGAGPLPLGSLLPYAAVVVALLTSAVEVWRTGHTDAVMSWVRSLLILLLVARQVLTLRENQALTRDLEDRVRERTAELEASREQLTGLAFTDSLTGLPNRARFKDRLQRALVRSHGRPETVGVLFLDLDGFKSVNDMLGHSAGDDLLVEVAARLRSVVRPGDTVARFGGDEFAVLLDDFPRDELRTDLAERINAVLLAPFELQGERVHVAASVGIARIDEHAETAEQVLRNADLAMYQAKAAGAGGFAVFRPEMHAGLVERMRLESDLRAAVETGQFEVHYQPMISMRSGLITAVEALVRWRHPERGLLPPAEFIPVAEATGMIRPLGSWVLAAACRQVMRWRGEVPAMSGLRVSVNVSPRQLHHGEFLDEVRAALVDSGLPPACLTLEMTESVLIDNRDETLAALTSLHDLGVRLAIDDFGTGYSSLSYLHRFPVDVLKIDRSFVERLSTGADTALVTTILRLGQSLQLETVAEGIERPQELLMLRRQGCTTGQGYHFSPPVPAGAMRRLLDATMAGADEEGEMAPA